MFLSRIFSRFIQRRFVSADKTIEECKKWADVRSEALCKNEPAQLDLKKKKTEGLLCTEDENLQTLESFSEGYLKSCLAIIQPRCKIVTQQGTNYLGVWELTFATKERWENPTMGWCSSGTSVSNLVLNFPSKEKAVEFAKKRGWSYSVTEKPMAKKRVKPKNYGDNFSYNRRTRISTK